jgi:fatty acid desaturase
MTDSRTTTGSRAWRAHTGGLAAATLVLALVVFVGHLTVWWAVLTGRMHYAVAVPVQTLLAYLAFTPMHEASHGNVSGNRKSLRRIDDAVGWAMAAMLCAPYPAFKLLHLRHHAHTNDAQRDPDYFVAGYGPLRVAAACLRILPHYYREFLVGVHSTSKGFRAQRRRVIGGLAVLLAFVGTMTVFGYGVPVFVVWMLPTLLATGMLAFAFDWLPHHPHDVQERYRDTRVILMPGLNLLLLGQNYHLIHHLYPRVPFHRYKACFETMRDELEREGAPIVSILGGGAERRGAEAGASQVAR